MEERGADYVSESTGEFLMTETMQPRLKAGAMRMVFSAHALNSFKEHGADYVCESTGEFLFTEKMRPHLKARCNIVPPGREAW